MILFSGMIALSFVGYWLQNLRQDAFSIRAPGLAYGRFPAQAEAPEDPSAAACFIDTFNLAKIRTEIAQMESAWPKKAAYTLPSNFSFLKNAKPPEIEYLARFGRWVTVTKDAAAKCKDLPCVLNSAYGRLDGEEGYRIYHFFLRMGYPLGTVRENPQIGDRNPAPLIQYLFKNAELEMFNLVSELLPAGYRQMPRLTSIHRIRDGHLPGWAAGVYSYYEGSPGTIVVKDPTDPSVRREGNVYTDYAFHVITHEMSHAYDRNVGEVKLKTGYWYSQLKEWKDKDWKKYELAKHGKIIAVDMPAPRAGEFVTAYAKTSTKEDFADTAALTFHDPALLRKNAPNKGRLYVYMSQYGRELHWDEWKNWASAGIYEQMLPQLPLALGACLQNGRIPGDDEVSDQLLGEEYGFFTAALRRCLQSQLNRAFDAVGANLNRNEYWACNYLGQPKKKEYLQQTVYRALANPTRALAENTEGFKKLLDLYDQAKKALDTCDADEAHVRLWDVVDGANQHKQEMESCVDGKLALFPDVVREFPELREQVLAERTWQRASERVRARINEAGKALPGMLKASAQNAWSACFAAAPVVADASLQPQVLNPYDGGSTFLSVEMLHCLNARAQPDYDREALANFQGTAVNLGNVQMRSLVQSMYLGHWLEGLKALQGERSKAEAAMNFSASVDAYGKGRAADLVFIKRLFDMTGDFRANCQAEVSTPVLDELKRLLAVQKEKWITIPPGPWTSSAVESVCGKVGQALSGFMTEEKSRLEALLAAAKKVLESKLKSIRSYIPVGATSGSFAAACRADLLPLVTVEIDGRLTGKTFRFFSPTDYSSQTTEQFCQEYWLKAIAEQKSLRAREADLSEVLVKILRQDLNWQDDIYSLGDHLRACHSYYDRSALAAISGSAFQAVASQDWTRFEDLVSALKKPACSSLQKFWVLDLEASLVPTAPLAIKIAKQARETYENLRRQKLSGCIAAFPRAELAFTRFQRKKCATDTVFLESQFSDVAESWEFQHEGAHPAFVKMVVQAVQAWVAEDKLKAEALIADLDAQGGGLIKK
ncbi:MAG: hypothetical protein JNL01_00920 [Bdellovibrionales bacterium]|nr:hypothetical protein [Bdellovibrionales bacterium]